MAAVDDDNQIGHDEGLYRQLYFDYEDEVEAKMKEQELFFAATNNQSEVRFAPTALPTHTTRFCALLTSPWSATRQEKDEAEEQEKVFRDPDFDAVASSLYRNPFQAPRGALPAAMIEWNR